MGERRKKNKLAMMNVLRHWRRLGLSTKVFCIGRKIPIFCDKLRHTCAEINANVAHSKKKGVDFNY